MKLHFDKQVELNIPASKAWVILAKNYEHVGEWATIIPESAARSEDGEIIGRTCSSIYGDVKEMITSWDEASMAYSYEADGLPSMFKSGKNFWKVEPINDLRSRVKMSLRMEMAPLPGFLMGWMIKSKMAKDLDGLMEDLKYYAEQGKPHPKKLKSLEKWKKFKAKKAA
ncbi:MAG: SRPBCC family protein [Bacteroidota bacterium]